MAHQTACQNSKNSSTLQDILDEDMGYYESINKELSPQLLVELGRLLLQQRAQLKQDKSKLMDRISNMEAEFNEEKSHGQQLEEYVKTMEEECENLRNLISYKEQQSEKRFNQFSEESSLMLEEVADELKKQRQTNMQLKNLLNQIKNKQNQIRKLTITLAKANEQNESLKNLKNLSNLLTEQLNQTEQKVVQLREAENKLRNQNEDLRDKINDLEQKVIETQYALNQIIKAKEIISEELEKRILKETNNGKQKQNSELLKQIENNYGKILGEYSDKDSPDRIVPVHQKKSADFQNSLDNISENWDKISLKEIEASSKGKPFGYNIFNLDLIGQQVNAFEVTKKKKQQTPIQKLYQKDEESFQFNHIPLSIDRKEKSQNEHQYQTVGKLKQSQDLKMGMTPLQSYRSVQNGFTPEADFSMGIKKLKASEFKDQQIKDKQLQHLTKKVEEYKKINSDLQLQIQKLESRIQEHVIEFQQETQKQAETIQRLATELKQEKILNIDDTRKKDEDYMRTLLKLTEKCEDYVHEIQDNKKVIQHEKRAFEQLKMRLLEIEEEKYQSRMNYNQSFENVHKMDQCIQTQSLLTSLSVHQAYNQRFHNLVSKKSVTTMTQHPAHTSTSAQTTQPQTVNKYINTTQTYSYRSTDRQNQSVNTEAQPRFDYSVQIKPDQLIKFKNKQIQNCALMKNVGVGQYLFDNTVDFGVQIGEKKNKLTIIKLQQKTVKKSELKMVQCQAQTEPVKKFIEKNEYEPQIKPIQNEKQNNQNGKSRQKQNWPIRKFNPTSMAQQAAQRVISFKEKQQQGYPSRLSLIEPQQQKSIEPQKSMSDKEITLQLLKLNIILVEKTKRIKSSHLPNLKNVKIGKCYQLDDIINKYKDANTKCRQYFVLYTIVTRDNQLVPDRLLLWREGLVSLYFGGAFLMTGTKKYIFDPVNAVLGNCEIIIDKHRQTIEVRKTTKNYFTGDIDECIWRVLTVEAYGQY